MLKPLSCQKLLLISFILLFSFSLFGQPENDHLEMNLNFEGSILKVDATYQVIVKSETDRLHFMLNPGFKIGKIQAPGLDTFMMVQKEGRPFPFLGLQFNKELHPGDVIDIQFEYQFDLKTQNHLNSDWIELNVDKMWFPNYDDLDNRFSYSLTVQNFPDDFTLIGHVDAVIERTPEKIKIQKTEPAPEVLILAGKSMRKWSFEDDIHIYGHQRIADSTITSMHEKIRKSIDYYNNFFGTSNKLNSFTLVLRNTKLEELGFLFSRENLIVGAVDASDYANLSHEIAHFWWSKADFINEPWLNESFANYSMLKLLEKLEPAAAESILKRYEEKEKTTIPVVGTDIFTPNGYDAYYVKGAMCLRALEQKIGFQAMKKLLTEVADDETISTAGFLKMIEENHGSASRIYLQGLLE